MKSMLIIFSNIYAISFLTSLEIGMLDAKVDKTSCKTKLTRIEYIVPGYRLGCWLNEQ